MMQRALGDEGFQDVPGGARHGRQLLADRRPGRRDPANDARPVGQPRAGEAGRRACRAARRDRRVPAHSVGRAEHLAIIKDEDLSRTPAQIRRRAADRDQRRGDRLGRSGRPDHRRDDGRLDQPSGYIKRTPAASTGRSAAAARGSKGPRPRKKIRSSTCSSPARTTTCCSSRTKGKVYWQKVYDLPELGRDSRGRAIVNLLSLAEGERSPSAWRSRDFDLPDHYLMMATRKGLVKKTPLEHYSRPKKGGIIAIKLREDDELVDVAMRPQPTPPRTMAARTKPRRAPAIRPRVAEASAFAISRPPPAMARSSPSPRSTIRMKC
jgi:hypothetical protein